MAIINLIRKELFHMRWIIIIGLLLAAGTAVITVITFHYTGQIVEDIPEDLMEYLLQFEVTREMLYIFSDYSMYLWSQWNAKNLLQLASLFAIIIASAQFAGEISKGTISFYLTRPVTRVGAYIGKISSGLLIMLIIFGGGTFLFWVSSSIMGYEADWSRLLGALFISLTWVATYYLLACIISVLNRDPITAGVVIGLSGILLSLPGLFEWGRQLSIFYHMRAMDYFVYGEPLLLSLGIGILVNALLLLAGLRVFSGRDF